MKHSKNEWTRWGQTHPEAEANIVAMDQYGQVVVLPEDGADHALPGDSSGHTAKTRAKNGELSCLVRGCGPFATAVGGQKKRHHFRHQQSKDSIRPGHDSESLAHIAAKHQIANWIETQLGKEIKLIKRDEYPLTTPRGEKVEPDVYVELSNGVKIAVEYQHSPGDEKDLRRKIRIYRQLNITMWWLYGSEPKTCRKNPKQDKYGQTFNMISPQRELLRENLSFHWYDCQRNRIGTPHIYATQRIFDKATEIWPEKTKGPRTQNKYAGRPWRDAKYVSLGDCALNRCTIDPTNGQLTSPKDNEIARDNALAQEEKALMQAEAHARFQKQSAELERRRLQEQEAELDQRRLQEQEAELDRSYSQAELVEEARRASAEATPVRVAPARPSQGSNDSSPHTKQPVPAGADDKPRVTLLSRLKRLGRRLIEPI